MSGQRMITVDGNEACASVAHRLNEVISIYPITPSSPMAELADEWAAHGVKNIWGTVPDIMEMQSEGGAAGAVHGALQAGALATTFTAWQVLLLMIPNMYKIAGELNAYCMHVAARSLATHALSIFGDHSDVMACRQTGFGMLCSGSVQEVHDFACIAQAAAMKSRVPFLHFFDGFRTSHELAKIARLSDDDLRHMIDDSWLAAHRERALTPDRPVIRGTAQNPDTFFQAREACNPFYDACPGVVQEMMDRFAAQTGRQYRLFDYVGHPQADRVIIVMGSGAVVTDQAVQRLNEWFGETVGMLKVRLYRPFSIKDFVKALPPTTKAIAVLDRTKEPGSVGEPMYQDIVTALREAAVEGLLPMKTEPMVIGGRYGLSSKEFTPAMVKGIFDELRKAKPKNHFTIGINDDVSHTSLAYDESFSVESDDIVRAVFFGLGADGTVGANKNSIKIIGEETDHYAQAYFVYDSKKAGAMTISHLRFGPRTIRSSYLIRKAGFVACHHFNFMHTNDVLDAAETGAVFLLNAPYGPDEVWDKLPRQVQRQMLDKKLKFYTIDAYNVAQEAGMGRRINTIMQTCFFAISGVLPREQAIEQIKKYIEKTYSKRGEEIVRRNFAAVDAALAHLHQVNIPETTDSQIERQPTVPAEAPDFVQRVTSLIMAGKGDLLPVSAFPVDGTWPVATSRWEKRNIALDIPIWDPSVCIQCNKCTIICPHAAIRAKVYEPDALNNAPETFQSMDWRMTDFPDHKFTIQVAPEDCTGCTLCVRVCPAKNKANPSRKAINMEPHREHVEPEQKNYRFFLDLPECDRSRVQRFNTKSVQLFQPLFEYSGACSGCGETPYIKLMTQLFGDRLLIANATGCSSIYGGNLPTTPYSTNREGRGPAWSNSLFEDNAEFGLGMRLAVDSHRKQATELLLALESDLGDTLVRELIQSPQTDAALIAQQRERVAALRKRLAGINKPQARHLEQLADYLVQKSVWLLGGDGWAYDIGYGGLDHVLASNRNVNILVLDTEVYSNTGGQQSKSTPLGAAAKFAARGKDVDKKDLGLIAMSYGNVYVATTALGANDNQTVKVFHEAESYDGPSLIIAYSHCIAHGYDLSHGPDQQKRAVESGIWPLYRFDPRALAEGNQPLQLDSKPPKIPVSEYMRNEARFRMVEKINPQRFHDFAAAAQSHAERRVAYYQQLSQIKLTGGNGKQN